MPTPPTQPPPLPPSFVELLSQSSLKVKHRMLQALNEAITLDEVKAPPHISDVSTYVKHIPELDIGQDLNTSIMAELESLNLHLHPDPNKVKTQWLSPTNEEYNYGKVINKPKPISEFKAISELAEMINKHPDSTGDMDACIVSCYPSGGAYLRIHADDEDIITQTSSICTVSFGPTRTLEFIENGKMKPDGKLDYKADLSLPATHHSLNIMHPGCQQVLRHRVPRAKNVDDQPNVRYSISFRKINSSLHQAKREEPGVKSTKPPVKENVILVAGDSFFARLNADLLGKRKQKVINISKGGSKMNAVSKSITDFVEANPNYTVKKLFISVGTNDIRYCGLKGVKDLKVPLSKLMKNVRTILPDTAIFFQSLLPIPSNGMVNLEKNVCQMNNLIFDMCSRNRMFYIDVFKLFIDRYGRRNINLFPKFNTEKNSYDIHPNKRGFGVLARNIIFLIHSKWFNPLGY